MSEKTPSKDEALEALDFIVNVLQEHEKDLDRLICELGSAADQLGNTGELKSKVKTIEEKLTGIQKDMGSFVKSFSTVDQELKNETEIKNTKNEIPKQAILFPSSTLSLLFQCKQWEDFQRLAFQAENVSFAFKDSEKTLEVRALKTNQVISYRGGLPSLSLLIKLYLSMQLKVPEVQILEGKIVLG